MHERLHNLRKFGAFLMLLQVVQGLIKVVAGSLGTLNQQMSHSYIIKQQLPPMLELEMHLAGGKVRQSPYLPRCSTSASHQSRDSSNFQDCDDDSCFTITSRRTSFRYMINV